MKLTVYLCSGPVCDVIREFGHVRKTCLAHGVEYHELEGTQISETHHAMADRAEIRSFPVFVAEDGLDAKVFDETGWAAFERALRGNGAGK